MPKDLTVGFEAMAHFLSDLSLASQPLALELVSRGGETAVQIVARDEDASLVESNLRSHFPDITARASVDRLEGAWGEADDGDERLVVEFALAEPFMMPLSVPRTDPFTGLVGALASLEGYESAAYQVSFAPLTGPWAESIISAVTRENGRPFFDDGPELVKLAKEKVSAQLYAAVIRLAARAPSLDGCWQIVRRIAAPLRIFSRPGGNRLTPLRNDNYDEEAHVIDLAMRRSQRFGMVLNLDELAGFVRFPTAAVRSPRFLRAEAGTRAVSQPAALPDALFLGTNAHAGAESQVWLGTEERLRHVHVIGASGSGKTNLLFNLMRQDAEEGRGFALLDPHGDLADSILGIIPLNRIEDVILVDPSDEEWIVPFNFLSAHSDFEKTLLASDLVAVFRAQSTSWGDQMNSVFGNAIRAFLESSRGGTLADLRRFLLDPKWREEFLTTVDDPEIVFYWQRGFPQLGGNRSIGPILTRLETFLSPKPIRYMVSQGENRLDFPAVMDRGKILIARLPQGQMGKENSHLLGALLIAKLQQAAMSRQRLDASERRPFFVYADEFQNFVCPSMAEILSGARKYALGFILAHQDLRQLERDREVAAAVLSNAFTRVAFRVSDSDARSLADGFAHFEGKDLQSLPIGRAVCRLGSADNDFNLSVPLSEPPPAEEAASRRRQVENLSQLRNAVPRAAVEAAIRRASEPPAADQERPAPKAEAAPAKVPASSIGSDKSPKIGETIADPAPDIEEPPLEKASPGKGGHQHVLLQDRIKAAAEAQGFRVFVEHGTGSGIESVDLVLLRGNLRIACEVSVSTTIDHEIGNARKCLREDFSIVALVTADVSRRAKLEAAVEGHFSVVDRKRIQCLLPESFLELLQAIPNPVAMQAEDEIKPVRGYHVRRTFAKLSAEERAAKTKAAFDLLALEMKEPPRP
ncbi:MAG TPA: type IV secretion system DNA-binding domain-containing protein [Verrucomicrobiales bacterium]|nr:type IV secretion system DNA-binding domain-containing protein [Verrucomicrobiales bacterium]